MIRAKTLAKNTSLRSRSISLPNIIGTGAGRSQQKIENAELKSLGDHFAKTFGSRYWFLTRPWVPSLLVRLT